MSKDLSKYPGLLKMCGYCSKKEIQERLEKEHYYCPVIKKMSLQQVIMQ